MSVRWTECSRLHAPIVTLLPMVPASVLPQQAASSERAVAAHPLVRHAPVADPKSLKVWSGHCTANALAACMSIPEETAGSVWRLFLSAAGCKRRACRGLRSVLVLLAPTPTAGRQRVVGSTLPHYRMCAFCSGLRSPRDAAPEAACERRARSRLRVVR